MIRMLRAAALALPLALAATALVHAHGDGAPSAIDTTGLEPLGENDRDKNPYVGNAKAVEIGASGYNKNCARCHGIDAKSGGMAPTCANSTRRKPPTSISSPACAAAPSATAATACPPSPTS